MKRWDVIRNLLLEMNRTNLAVVEVGVERGKTAEQLLSMSQILNYWCVDMWRCNQHYAETASHKKTDRSYHERNFARFLKLAANYPQRVRILTTGSASASKLFRVYSSIDLVFIDADHSYSTVLSDIKAWYPTVKHHGILCGHDYGDPRFPGVREAVEKFFGNDYETADDFMWFHRKHGRDNKNII